ncbi:hypothetical protein [Sphingobacterium sp. 2149]|uniref:hypothetical protein n=1 Tax=Sphingobacterium sp. 2149 TaxID=2817763 RepID=UPI002856115B|nr:hypothetical protein [Sphingobacterium sp. 2149]MDR6734166.1 hypothetical protein [Sphingobacterium sp. 2149]
MSENKTTKKKLSLVKGPSYDVHNVTGASLAAFGFERSVLNFFIERPTISEYAEVEIQNETGILINEKPNIKEGFLDVDRVFVTGIEMDYKTLKSISTLLLNHINAIENTKVAK